MEKPDVRREQRRRELQEEILIVNQNKVVDFSDQDAQARFLAAVSLKHGQKKLGGKVASRIRTEQEIKDVQAAGEATRKLFQSKKINLTRKQKRAIKLE